MTLRSVFAVHRPRVQSTTPTHYHYCDGCDQEWPHEGPTCLQHWAWRCPRCLSGVPPTSSSSRVEGHAER